QHELSDSLVLSRLAEDDPQAPGTLTVSGGVASMQGTAADDQIEFRMTDSVIAITRNTWGKAFSLGTISQFAADGGDGDDTIIAANASAETIVGDAGHDTAQADELLDELHGVES